MREEVDASGHFPEVVEFLSAFQDYHGEIRIRRLKSYLIPLPPSLFILR